MVRKIRTTTVNGGTLQTKNSIGEKKNVCKILNVLLMIDNYILEKQQEYQSEQICKKLNKDNTFLFFFLLN